MKTLTVILVSLFVPVVALGCATNKAAAPAPPSAPAGEVAKVVTLTPYMADPAFVVRFRLPRPDEWAEQWHLQTPPGNPDVTLRLQHRPTGGEIDFMVIPPIRPSDVATQLSAKLGQGFKKDGPVDTAPSGDRSSFSAKGERAGIAMVSRVVIFRQKAMTDATLIIAAEWPASADAKMRPLMDAVAATVAATAIGPDDPRVSLAMCLNEKGYRYYGASWCGYCHQQEEAFGPGMSRLRHVDCSPPSAEGARIPECADEKITTYPTWIRPDGTKATGVRDLADLAKDSGCPYAPKQ